MSDDFAISVIGILKALDSGIRSAKRVSKSANAGPVFSGHSLQALESAQKLQKSLENSSRAISDAYKQNAGQCGESFTTALVEDRKSRV